MTSEKAPPHDAGAEEATIGSLLVDPDAMLKVATFLNPEDFFQETNQWIYRACLSLYQRDEIINQITVAHELIRQEKLERGGGVSYLSYLVSVVPTSLHVEHYARIVFNMALMRKLIAAGAQIAAIGYEAAPDVDASFSRAEDVLFQVRKDPGNRNFVLLRDALGQYFEQGEESQEKQAGQIPHVLTGFAGIDDLLGGLQRSDLVILAARPSMGKTSLALNIARNTALSQKACVVIFSLETSCEAMVHRLLSSETGIDSRAINLRQFTDQNEAALMKASGVLSEAAIYIDDSSQPRVLDMRSKARRLHFEHGIDLIIIDYLQLISGTGKYENRVQEMSAITRSLKMLARELNVPVLVISQLSRAVEWRASHVPQLADLRDSGSIEQDADIVLFVYREELYCKTLEEWEKTHGDLDRQPYPRGIAEVVVAKHRNGPLGQVKLRFSASTAKFENLGTEPLPLS